MKNVLSRTLLSGTALLLSAGLSAQTFTWYSSTQGSEWEVSKVRMKSSAENSVSLSVDASNEGTRFLNWGTCFNELGWDALNMLTEAERNDVMSRLFSPSGDMRFTIGRFSMNANDYARDWYSCDEVDGDFQLKHFNIERDKQTLVPYIKLAQKYNPDLKFWVSPWSPPSWMKVNHYYSVRSDKKYNTMDPRLDYILFQDSREEQSNLFPRQLAVNDYMIQDPRYLSTYADYFCRFISAYKELDIPIYMVMFQNESWSYTVYPGCAWTPEGIIRFNAEYLGPALKKNHPDVSLYLGTINTNRFDVIDKVLSDSRMPDFIKGVGFQWEGRQILPGIRKKYPDYKYVQTESECGWGSFDWKAAEHTFNIINEYLANGCEEYTFWNAVLSDDGVSGWGWKQNSLIRVDSKSRTLTYTPEYYAVKHYCQAVVSGSRIIAARLTGDAKLPVMVCVRPDGKYAVIAGNLSDKTQNAVVKIGKKYLSVSLKAHSFNTFIEK